MTLVFRKSLNTHANKLFVFINQLVMDKIKHIPHFAKYLFFFIVMPVIFYLLRTNARGDTVYGLFDTSTPIAITDAGATAIYYLLFEGVFAPLNISGADTYIIMATIFGGLATFVLWKIAKMIFHNLTVIYFLLVSLSGATGLFFGYIEAYAILNVSILLYLLAGVYVIKFKKSLFYPTITASLVAIIHLIGFVVLPSLLFLFYYVYKNNPAHSLVRHCRKYLITYLFLIAFAYIIMWPFKYPVAPTDDLSMWSPFLGIEKQMIEGFISLAYYKAKVSELVIASGTIIFAVLILLCKKILSKTLDEIDWFLSLLSAGLLVPLVVINTVVQGGDWGVTVGLGYPLLFLGLKIINDEEQDRILWLLTTMIFSLFISLNFFWYLWTV